MNIQGIKKSIYHLFIILVSLVAFFSVPKYTNAVTYTDANSDSLLNWVMNDMNNLQSGYYALTIDDMSVTYNIHLYVYDGDQTWISNMTFGDAGDVATSSAYAQNMVVVLVKGNLTIGTGVTVTAYNTTYGGPKGMMLYVNGDIINNGTISMSSRGAKAVGQNIYLWKNANGTYETVPAVGGAGVAAITAGTRNGTTGNAGSGRQTGGGGGGSSYASYSCTMSASGAGTSFSGGTGSGACAGQEGASGAGAAYGGAGGFGRSGGSNPSGGGAGNPGGSGSSAGSSGTGGLLILFGQNINNTGTISANGANGGKGNSAGGSSGGGSVNIFYTTGFTRGTITADGGSAVKATRSTGGAGGAGTVTATQLVLKEEFLHPTLSSLSVVGNTLTPSFQNKNYEYYVTLDSENSHVTVNATLTDEENTIVSGVGEFDIPMGTSDHQVVITSFTGSTQVYTIHFYRPPSSYKYLKGITIDGEEITGFSPTKLEYNINVPYYSDEIDLGAILGRTSQETYGEGKYNLNSGNNKLTLTVVSEDGNYTTNYTLNIFREHSTKLKSVDFDGFDLEPEFNPETNTYELILFTNTMSVKVNAIPYDEEATVTLNGFGYIKNNGTGTITVTEPNSAPTVYTITITKDAVGEEIIYDFNSQGSIETFEVQYTGYYKIETWGAQGGNSPSFTGGYGAYAVGYSLLKRGDVLYIGVGKQGTSQSKLAVGPGGWNGGGTGGTGTQYYGGSGGGGATHIAKVSGILSNLSNNKDDILIVAGGGGGASGHLTTGYRGGDAGGISGVMGPGYRTSTSKAYGGTQTSGYQFGLGQNGRNGAGTYGESGAGGGGGGWYGGNASQTQVYGAAGGGGGSSYIGNPNLTSYQDGIKSMYCYNCQASNEESTYTVSTTKYSSTPTSYYAKSGDGFARITFMAQPSENNFLSSLTVKHENEVKTYTPEFDMQTYDYYLTLDEDETSITVSARPEDSLATIDGLGEHDIPAGTTDIEVKVTAESGDERIYTIHVTRPASSNQYPIDIVISGLVPSLCGRGEDYCNLDPEKFNPYNEEYFLIVPSRIKQLYFSVEKGHAYQTVHGEGKVTLAGGENTIVIEVLSEDGTNYAKYTYTVYRDMSSNTDLSILEVTDPERDIHYDPDITDYYISVPNEYTSIGLNYETDDPLATATVDGNKDFKTGMNVVSIIVVAQNGESIVYNINVYREKNSNVYLNNLKVVNTNNQSVEYELNPEFNKIIMEYNVTVPNDVDKINLIATPESSTTTVDGAGTKELKTGLNKYSIVTTSESGDIETYTVNITREKNSNANLSDISVSDNTTNYNLDPTFDKNELEYRVEVDEGVSKITITATPEVSTTTYKLLDSNSIRVGENVKRVMAIAEDGTTKTYTLTIVRSANTNNFLSSLEVKDTNNKVYDLTPSFDKTVSEYTLEVENEVSLLKVTGTKENVLATVKGNGEYGLAVGTNTISITVTSESGEIRNYDITVTRKPNSDATLRLISTNVGVIVPEFDKETYLYSINVENEVSEIEITGIPTVNTTKVTGNGTHTLTTGTNRIELVTLAEDGVSTKTYVIEVTKDQSDNDNIKYLLMEEGAISPEFKPDIIKYTASVPYEVESGTFHVELENEKASYTIAGANHFNVGENTVTITVTSEAGTEKVYTVTVTREEQETSSNYLTSITNSVGTLNPNFSKLQQYYEIEVPYTTTSITIDATKEDNAATLTGTGKHNLNVGKNLIVLRVTGTDGKTRDYQIVVTREENDDARLGSLVVQGSILTPSFNSDVYEYSLDTTDGALIFNKLTTVDPNATYEVLNNEFTNIGAYKVTIRVTAANKITTKDYVLNVNKLPSNNNNLASLEVVGHNITPTFNKATTLYRVTVPSTVNSVLINATAEHPNSTITGTGSHELVVGENQIVVEVTSESGNKKSYVVVVTKEGSNNNDITDLIVHNGVMTPEFSSSNLNYSVEVPYSETSLDLTVILADDNATYAITGNDLNSSSTVYVTVTAENGTTKTYILDVIKKNIVSSLLKDLVVDNYELNPIFIPQVNNYDLLVNYETTKLDLTAIPFDKNAKVEISGNENLIIGNNIITITVTASDDSSTTVYTLNVRRQAYANTYLDYLYTSEGDVTPIFKNSTLKYSIEVDRSVEEIELFGEPVDKSMTVEGLGTHKLEIGENKIPVTVTSPSGSTRTYWVNVIRKKDNNNYLDSLTLKVGNTVYELDPEFNREKTEYSVTVPIGTNAVTLEGTFANTASVNGLGIRSIVAGVNKLAVIVIAEDGTTKTYIITVNRLASDNNHLIEIIPSVGTLEPSFSYDGTDYTIHLDSSSSILGFDVVTEETNASVAGAESMVVPDGTSIRQIVVTAENGDTRVYNITIIKDRADDAKLSSLSVDGYPFKEEFNPDVYEYHITVPNNKLILLSSEVKATARDKNATITKQDNVLLETGTANIYTVKVTAPDGFTTQEYLIYVEREKGTNTTLTSLDVNVGSIMPSFNPNLLEYTWTVPKGTTTLVSDNVIAVAADKNAVITKTESLDISARETRFEVTVTSEDGSANTKYYLNVEIEQSSDATLSNIEVEKGLMKPSFSPDTTVYDVYEYEDTLTDIVTVTKNDEFATITSGGGEVTLNDIDTTHNVVITAEDGTTKTYTLNFHKTVAHTSGLQNLDVDTDGFICRPGDCTLTPSFDNNTDKYTINVPNDYATLKLIVETLSEDQTYKVKVNNLENNLNLNIGTNEVVVEVYDGLNNKTNTYTINVTRRNLYDGRLDSLTVTPGFYEPDFDADVYTYDVYEYFDTNSINISATLKDDTSTITSGLGEVNLTDTLTNHNIVVTTADGETVVYELIIHRTILRDGGLKNLGLNGLDALDCSNGKCTLTPTFDTDTHQYKISVPNEYEDLDVLVETMNDQQSYKVKVADEYVEDYKLSVGKTNVTVEVYDGMGALTDTYTLEVTRNKPSNIYLKSLKVDDYVLEPEFKKDIFEYYIEIPGDINEVKVEAVPEDDLARVKVNGYNYLEEGDNDVTITVTAQDGTKKDYIVHILKLGAYDNFLRNITVSTGLFWELEPTFKKNLYEYNVTIPGIYDKVTIEGIPNSSTTTVEGNGEHAIITGNNRFELKTKAEDGSSRKYVVNVIKLESYDVDLERLIVEEGNLNPEFDPVNTKYEVHVDETVEQLTIHAIPKDPKATILITGNNNLISGENKVNVIVMSSDKSMSKTYQLTVYKDKSSNTNLSSLHVIDENTDYPLNPNFDPNVYNYRVEVPHDVNKVEITASTESLFASVIGTGEEYLDYGSNIKNVTVTAESGEVMTYVIDIYRNYNLNLADLVSDVGTLSPEFNKDTLEYTLDIGTDIEEVSFIALPESNKVSVIGNGTYNFGPGETSVLFQVLAPDGKSKTYTVTVNKKPDDNNYIESLVVHEGGIDPIFDRETTEYEVNVRKTTTSINMDIILESKKAHYEVIGNENFEMGENEVIIRVTAESGAIRDYKVKVILREDEYFSNRLLDLSISEGKLNPDFDPDIYYYAANLPNSTESVIISATKESDGSVVTGTGLVNLEVGRNVFPVTVTSKEGNVNTYTIVIYRANNNDATLSSLSITGYPIKPVFSKAMTRYSATVMSDEIEVIAIPTDKNSKVEITGNKDLVDGVNTVTIKVTAPDEVTTKTYTITVTKVKSTNNYLSSLEVSGYDLEPEFEKTNTGPYTISVDANVNSIVIDAVPEVKTTTVDGLGVQTVDKGNNIFKVTATSESGDERVYTIIVKKSLNSDNTLKDLIVSDGTLDPVFDPETLDYTVMVPEELDEFVVIGFANAPTSTVVGNGTYPLDTSIKSIPIIVTAEDGSTRTYTINVVKDNANSSKILDLIVKNGELMPHFNKNIINYTVKVPNEVTSLDMIVILEDDEATYTIEGNENFEVGSNTVKVKVTNKDDSSETIYTIDVVRGKVASNYLTNLRVEGYQITPYFDKETLYYTLTVPNNVTTANIIATLEDASSTLTGTGIVNLEVGRNDNYVTVTSASGVVRTYTVSITRDSNHSSKILDLIVKNGELQPHFDKDTITYDIDVPNEVTSLDMIVTLEDPNASYKVQGNSDFQVGKNTVNIIVKDVDGYETIYTLNVNRGTVANNYLTSLEVEGYKIAPTFNKETLYYTLTVPNTTDKVNIIATLEDASSTVTGTGETTLNVGRNDKYVTVTSSDGVIRTYTISITRSDESNAKIMDLIVKNGELKPKFNKDINNYNVIVPNEVTSLDIEVILDDYKATYEIIGNENFNVGDNTVQVVVTGSAGNKNTYTINVTRGTYANNYLSNLEVEGYNINPTFNKETLYYTVEVPYNVDKVNIIATLEDASSTVTGTGETALNVGRNDKYVTVTSSDGVIRTYTININRAEEFSSKIMDLIVKNGELKPKFDKNTTDYTVAVPYEVTKLDMIVTLEDEAATYSVLGNSNFEVGPNLVQVMVTSKKGEITTYRITVIRGELANNYLTNLEVEGYNINPTFNKETLYYTLEVPNTTDKVNIIATLEDSSATVTGNGIVSLDYGRNDKYVTVTSSDGVIRTYTISITRKDLSDVRIMDLIVKNGELKPKFNKDITDYKVAVPYEVTSLDMIVVLENPKSSYEIIGNENFNIGDNTVKVIVTGEDGTKNTYTITVTRGTLANNYLTNLEVEGYNIIPEFNKETLYYTLTVPNNISKVKIKATLEDPSSTVTGTGETNLSIGKNDKYVTVTSSDGVIRTYTISITRDSEFSSKILDLIVKNGELKPSFNKDITDYKVSVPYEVTKLDMIVTLEDKDASYKVVGNDSFKVGSNNLVQVIVTSKTGDKTTYLINVTRGASANNYLTSLEVEGYNISPTFNKETLYYTLEVPNDISKVNIKAILEDPSSTVTGTGETSLNVGRNDKYVTVTSSDGVIRTYTISITRKDLSNTKIMDLIVKNGELQPHFDKDTNKYNVFIPYEVTSLDMIVVLDDYKSTYEIIGNENFKLGTNNVSVVVTGEDGTKNTYTINAYRGAEANNFLANLEVEGYNISPEFNKETLYYTVNVPYNVDKVNIIATKEDASEIVTGDGITSLDYGRNDKYVSVISSDGIERTYTVVIYRDEEFSSKIRDLIVKNGELQPHFDKNITDYTVYVPNEVTKLDMIVTLEDNEASYSVLGNSNFEVGPNLVQVMVTSKKGEITTYRITVIRGELANNYLTNLEVEGYNINPTFNKETLYYTLTVPQDIDKVNIIATLEDPSSSVTGTGEALLNIGRNDKYVTVTSSDGVIRTYTISITRESEDDNKLLTLESDIGSITPTFEPTVNEYTLNIPNTATEVNLTGTISNGATETGLGKITITDNINHNIVVTSQSGKVNTYIIHIVKSSPSTELNKLIPSVGTMNYSNDITDYEFEVEDSDSLIYFDYELSDPTATITGVELRPLNYGENEIEIVVTASNGDERVINVKVFRNKDLVAIIPDEESVVLAPKEEKLITYTFNPIDTTYTDVEFSIEDEDIATVDELGNVTALKNGSTTLTITSKDKPSVFATVTIDVLNTKITSSILDVIRDVPEEECEFDTCEDIVIGEELMVGISEFIKKFDNDETYLHVYDSDDNEIEDLTTYTGSFMKLKLVINDKVYDELIVLVRGDINGDGESNSADDVGINNIILRKLKLNYCYLKIFDFNIDGDVNAADDIAINNYILRKIKSLNLK
ncbi:MAG: cadherin-like beta sandwich domain-containing protein [Ruminococcus sp.]|nr:cadherin-like beta sandwich domain-containing protein [Ruminococcus sp.]